jgi:hypothetical protein
MSTITHDFLNAAGLRPAFRCMVCGKREIGEIESVDLRHIISEPGGWFQIGEAEWYEEGWCCGCIPTGWGLHCSGQWIKPGFARVVPLPHAKWLTPVGVHDCLRAAIRACEENADEIHSFKEVL